jgi:ABC-type nitrate/sulfonate/bicarbonate transport system ATPase subunit
VGLPGMGDRYPREMSAGMQQRVGIARAFALEPRLLLLDEPFSLLDALTRMELQDQLMTLWEATRKTVIMVTHDVDEALLLADRIVMMTNGPAATIGEIMGVPFPRPRQREEILTRPDYFWLRDSIHGFLEERAHAPA